MLVPNVDDKTELAVHIRTMFYITAGVATVIFILVIISKMILHFLGGPWSQQGWRLFKVM